MYVGQVKSGPGHNESRLIDLRSDTVTRPTPAMLNAMAEADVGDDVFGDDPTVNLLEAKIAETFGKEAGLFLPSGTQSNLCALLTHCQRGEEVLVGRSYHVFCAEARGSSVLGGISLDPLPVAEDNALEVPDILAAVKPDDPHLPITRLLSLENTVTGKAVPLDRMERAAEAGRSAGLVVHLDGARAFNAAIALGITPMDLARSVDTVSVCLSKGLGTPAGTVLVGPASFIHRARRWRKMLGGGMRQSGVLAAAGLYALEHEVPRLKDDHNRAERLRTALNALPGASADLSPHQTNMALITLDDADQTETVLASLYEQGIQILGANGFLRLVVHRDLDDDAIDHVIAGFDQALS